MLAVAAVLAYATYRFYSSDTKKEEVEDDFVVIDEDPATLRKYVWCICCYLFYLRVKRTLHVQLRCA